MKVASIILCASICACTHAATINTESVMADTDYDVIVVGMGAAGITAASTLAQAGVKVLGLEAMDRIGGRVNTVPFGDGVVEMGGEWIHGTSPSRTYDLAIKHGVQLIEQDVSLDVYSSDGSPANSSLVNELLTLALDAANEQHGANEPLGEFITRQVTEHLKEHYPSVLEDKDYVEEILHLLDLVIGNYEGSNSWHDVTTKSQYQELDGPQHMSWGANGYKTLFDILLNKYNNGTGLPSLTIKLNTEVQSISYADSARVTVRTAAGAQFTARTVIVTVSLGVLKARHKQMFNPKLPEPKQTAIEMLSIGVMDKIVFLFERPWWPVIEPAFFGFLWKGKDRKRIPEEDHWLYRVFAASTPKGSKHALTLWTSGDVAKMVETMPEDVVKTKLMGLIRRFMGKGVEVPEPIAMMRSTWFHNPYTRGSYSYDNLQAPEYPTARADLEAPITDSAGNPLVLFAGEATDPHHFSTVHGATDTGHREATRILEHRAKSHL